MSSRRTFLLILLAAATVAFAQQPKRSPDVPYVPTTERAVEEMLKLANVTKSDAVYDLGCGDGRIVITAAKKYGAHGVGIDINPERIKEARANAKKAGVEDLVRFEENDLFVASRDQELLMDQAPLVVTSFGEDRNALGEETTQRDGIWVPL